MTVQRRTGQVQLATLHAKDDEIFQTQGRIGRMQYWSHSVIHSLMGSVVGGVIGFSMVAALLNGKGGNPFILAVLGIVLLIWTFLVTRWTAGRRCHDVGMSAWWCLLFLVPVVNAFFSLYLALAPGYISSNRWGRPPSPPDGWVVVIFWITFVAFAILMAISFISNVLVHAVL